MANSLAALGPPLISQAPSLQHQSPRIPVSLAEAGVDLSRLGRNLCVPVRVRQVARPSVIWVNHRWFHEYGLDLSVPDTWAHVNEWLLNDFAFAVPSPEDSNGAYGQVESIFWADRYGATGGGCHGGSGRCGIYGRFNVKGIGRTPLVSTNVDVMHSSGTMHLSEALVEAIVCETLHPELPHGCIPVVAIIDMGFTSSTGPDMPARRRSLLIRPNFIRPSHFERSIFFGSAGTVTSDQFVDAQRVREAVHGVVSECGRNKLAEFLTIMFRTAASQLGAARANRIWLSLFTSSNRTVDGALLDFGGVRAVSTWRAMAGRGAECFGSELPALLAGADSVMHFFSKYLDHDQRLPNPGDLKKLMATEVTESFQNACASAIGVERNSDCVQALCEYYALQQYVRINQNDRSARRRPWILDALVPSWRRAACPGRVERQTAQTVLASIAAGVEAPIFAARESALKRWLLPRHLMFGDIMCNRVPRFTERLPVDPNIARQLAQSFVDRYVGACRRVWQGVPSHLSVEAQAVHSGSCVLFCKDHRSDEERILVSGWQLANGFLALGSTFAVDDRALESEVRSASGSSVWINIGNESAASEALNGLRREAQKLRSRAFTYRL